MNSKLKKITYPLLILSIIGFIDSLYLTASHFMNSDVVCNGTSDCSLVLTSEYAEFFGIPVALFGVIYYGFILIMSSIVLDKKTIRPENKLKKIFYASSVGFIGSAWFVYLQAFVIYSYCTYCMVSAAASTLIFIISIYGCFMIRDKVQKPVENKKDSGTI
jgi:uncharacterized membrane protein